MSHDKDNSKTLGADILVEERIVEVDEEIAHANADMPPFEEVQEELERLNAKPLPRPNRSRPL